MRRRPYAIKRLAIVVGLLLGICYSKPTLAQGQFTNMGTDFLLAFYQNHTYIASDADLHLEFKIVAPKATNVKITYLSDNTVETFPIAANTVHSYVLNAAQRAKVYPNTSTTTAQKTVMRIETDNGVAIYAINMWANTSDGTAVLPISNYGSSYLNIGVSGSSAVVIATEDDTRVSVNGAYVGTLGKFEARVFGTVGNKISAESSLGEPRNIAVFNVHQCSSWPSGACDTQWEQLVPIANLGKEFFIPKTNMSTNAITVVAEQATTITYQIGTNPTQTTTVSSGSNTTIYNNTAGIADMHLSASLPVAITTHIGGTQSIPASENEDGVTTSGGDPSTAWVPPFEQNIISAYITPFKGGNTVIKAHYAIIVVETASKSLTTVDDAAPVAALNTSTNADGWRDHLSGYSSIVIHLPEFKPYLIANPSGMVLLAYGVGGSESYYYLAAASARKLNAAFYITNGSDRYHYQDANLLVPFDCGSPFTFEAEIEYELNSATGHLKWYVDGVEVTSAQDLLTWTQPYLSAGEHTIKLVVKNADGVDEELETTLNVECATNMTPTTATLDEGQTQEMTISLSGTAPTNIEFALSAHTGTTASATDYSFPATVTFTAGNSEVRFNVLAVADNVINEPDEVLVLRAYNSEYGELFATITIKDVVTEAQKTLTISATPIEIYEASSAINPSPTQSTVTVSLPAGVTSHTAISGVQLSYGTSTATIGADYTINSGNTLLTSITIPTTGSQSFVINTLEDNLYEGDEYVSIAATAPSGYTMGTSSVSVKVIDQTSGEIVVATLNDGQESPLPTSGYFRIRFSKTEVTTKKAIKVVYTLTGTTNDGTTYQLINPTEVTIAVDQSYKDVEIKPINNYAVEGARTVKITLLSATPI